MHARLLHPICALKKRNACHSIAKTGALPAVPVQAFRMIEPCGPKPLKNGWTVSCLNIFEAFSVGFSILLHNTCRFIVHPGQMQIEEYPEQISGNSPNEYLYV